MPGCQVRSWVLSILADFDLHLSMERLTVLAFALKRHYYMKRAYAELSARVTM